MHKLDFVQTVHNSPCHLSSWKNEIRPGYLQICQYLWHSKTLTCSKGKQQEEERYSVLRSKLKLTWCHHCAYLSSEKTYQLKRNMYLLLKTNFSYMLRKIHMAISQVLRYWGNLPQLWVNFDCEIYLCFGNWKINHAYEKFYFNIINVRDELVRIMPFGLQSHQQLTLDHRFLKILALLLLEFRFNWYKGANWSMLMKKGILIG